MDLVVEPGLVQPQAELAAASVPMDGLLMAQALPTNPALAAWNSNTLGVGFSGSGFLVMYFVGVSAILRALGVINTTTRLAGSSGGSVAAAMSCSSNLTALGIQAESYKFFAGVGLLTSTCRAINNCNGTLDATLRLGTGLLASVPPSAIASSKLPNGSRLYISVTAAKPNAPDVEVKVSSFSSIDTLVNAMAASSYIPRFSGTTLSWRYGFVLNLFTDQTRGLATGSTYVNDGVLTNPLPEPPSTPNVTVTYTIKVSALADGGRPPNFSSLINNVNAFRTPAQQSIDPAGYYPLNPTLQTQPTSVDIWPGLSGGLPSGITNATWNSYVLIAPTTTNLQAIFDQGRKDAAAWVLANLGTLPRFNQTAIASAMTWTAFKL